MPTAVDRRTPALHLGHPQRPQWPISVNWPFDLFQSTAVTPVWCDRLNPLDSCSCFDQIYMPKSSFQLVPLSSADIPLDFDIDFETGDVSGRDAARVVGLCEAAIADRYVVGHPYPTSYDIRNPFNKIQELAVVLGQYWRLDGKLIDAYPKVEFDEGSSGIPVVY